MHLKKIWMKMFKGVDHIIKTRIAWACQKFSQRANMQQLRTIQDSNYSTNIFHRAKLKSRDFLQLPIANVCGKEGENKQKEEKSGWYQVGTKKEEKEGGKMRYYEFIPDFRVRYKSLFGFEYSILKHLSWASITVLSVSFPARSKVGTHENILHFPPRFTRCIL